MKTSRTKPDGRKYGIGLVMLAMVVVACGEAPLATLGQRSSAWVNEPEVTTTVRTRVEAPTFVSSLLLDWYNDDIETADLEDGLLGQVFSRREGDRFIQASRFEIAAAIPDIQFPSTAPFGAEWVSSQLVFENSGVLSSDPTVAFGIWSAVPYTRSRTVGQMAVLRVFHDADTAAEMEEFGDEFSCGRFAERTTEECAMLMVDDRPIWKLAASGGNTLIWFHGDYRYELFGRSFVPSDILEGMASETMPLDSTFGGLAEDE